MLEPVGAWEIILNNLPKTEDNSWARNLASAVDGLTTGKMELTNIKTIPASFVFGKVAFEAALLPLLPVNDAISGANHFAEAWAAGVSASFMSVSGGASVGLPPTPVNTFAPLPATSLDPSSLTTAKQALVIAITTITPSADAKKFAKAFRDAFLALTYSTTGMNIVTPTPTPLVDPSDPTI